MVVGPPQTRVSRTLAAGAVLGLLGFANAPASTQQVPPPEPAPLVFRNVTVIDGTGAPPAPGMAVVVERGRITAVTPLARLRLPPRARVVDATGRFLIAGLWDMHVHTSSVPVSPVARGDAAFRSNSRYYLPLFVAWGVTSVRDMSGTLELLLAWRDSVRAGALLGPRMVITGAKLGGSKPVASGAPYPLRNEADLRNAVRALKRAGADFVKVAGLPGKWVAALAEECRLQGLQWVGHLPDGMTLPDASRAGQHSVEHLDGALLAQSSREAELRRREKRQDAWWTRWLARLHLTNPDGSRVEVRRAALASPDAARAENLYALLAHQQTWQVPTLTELRDLYRVGEPEPFAEERREYTPPPRLRDGPVLWERDPALARRYFARQMGIVGEMYRAGVPILAGTDTPGTDRIPGFSLAEELELLVRAGLPPLAALQSATREPARFLGLQDSLGTVEAGKLADLVVLDADPLRDIRNVHRVHAVVLAGRYLPPATLDSLRSSVRHLVAAWRDSVARQPAQP